MAKVHERHILVRSKTKGRDPMVDKILDGDDVEFARYKAAKELFEKPIKKTYVEACLLASEDITEIGRILEMKPDTIIAYKEYFYNIEGLDKLSKIALIEESDSPDEKVMKLWSYSQGLDFVSWRLGNVVAVDPVGGLKDLFTLSIYKSKEALFSGSHTDAGKEATKWTKLSMDLARILKLWVMDSNAARRDIEMALKTINPQFKGFDDLVTPSTVDQKFGSIADLPSGDEEDPLDSDSLP